MTYHTQGPLAQLPTEGAGSTERPARARKGLR